MTLQEFIEKWNGKYLEVAGSANAKNQCTDAANAYIRDVLNFPIIEWTNAIDFPSKGGVRYDYIKNTPTGVPSEGDLVIWGGTTAGHIAIFIEGNANSFRSFDQNYPTGSPCHVQNHTYTNVLSWMHPIVTKPVDDEIIKRADAFVAVASRLNDAVDKDVVLADIDRLLKIEDVLSERQKELDDKTAKLTKLAETVEKLTKDNQELLQSSDALQVTVEAQRVEINDVKQQIEQLKKQKPISEYSRIELFIKAIFG